MKNLLIITGASRGIGLKTAELFKDSGWDVINISRSICDIDSVKNYQIDLADLKSVADICSEISSEIKEYSKVSIVHNASILQKDSYKNLDQASFERVMRVNVISAQVINMQLVDLLPNGSSVIFVGSTLSEKAAPNSTSYTVSKHAIAGVMKSLAQDISGKNIHTALVCPGFTETEMLMAHLNNDKEVIEAVKQMVLMKRLIKPEEIASLILFAANNPVINGSVLHANLGQ